MPGCKIYECATKEFDAATLQVKAVPPGGDPPTQTLEGLVEIIHYVCPAKLSPLQLHRNAENALKAAGFTLVFSGKDENDFQMLTARKASQWVNVRSRPFDAHNAYDLTGVKVEEMKQELTADASALAAEISKSGSVAVYGINFETGKAALQAGSEQVLEEIVKVMKAQPDWRFEVQGHTDNVGAKPANLALSQQRAAAVAAWLTKHGVDAARLVPKGYGDSAPVADNSTDEGRTKNRRVELKKLNDE